MAVLRCALSIASPRIEECVGSDPVSCRRFRAAPKGSLNIDWRNERVVVTGGTGFLGSYVMENLYAHGCKTIITPRSREYDLVHGGRRAAVPGREADARDPSRRASGRNRSQSEESRLILLRQSDDGRAAHRGQPARGPEEAGRDGTICAYPKFAPVPFREDDLWNGYPEETNAPYGPCARGWHSPAALCWPV